MRVVMIRVGTPPVHFFHAVSDTGIDALWKRKVMLGLWYPMCTALLNQRT